MYQHCMCIVVVAKREQLSIPIQDIDLNKVI
jgi:hypothetical protein